MQITPSNAMLNVLSALAPPAPVRAPAGITPRATPPGAEKTPADSPRAATNGADKRPDQGQTEFRANAPRGSYLDIRV